MKLLLHLPEKELSKFKEFTNSFIIGLKDYSVNYFEYDISQIQKIKEKYPLIELFVSINKNIFNKDIEDLKDKLTKLEKLDIAGILFYDLSVLKIVKEMDLKIDLVYHGTHFVTNYNICNYYYDHGVKYVYLSTEITAIEMKEIIEKTKCKSMAYFIGHPIISHSKRKLISNFCNYYQKENKKEISVLSEKNKNDKKYYIIESNLGTNILTFDVLNGTKAFIQLKDTLDYAILDSHLMDEETFLEIVKYFKMSLDDTITNEKLISKIETLIGSYDGFFYKKTIYKVK